MYITFRALTGLFDCVISITQEYPYFSIISVSYVADITNMKDRAICMSRLEMAVNAGFCSGPFIAGLISVSSVMYAM